MIKNRSINNNVKCDGYDNVVTNIMEACLKLQSSVKKVALKSI